jgi:hypothetical protein
LIDGFEFERRIEKAIKDSERSYNETIRNIRELKERISELEISISEKGNTENSEEMRELNSLEEKLNASVDSLILRSEAEWEDYRRLEQECGVRGFDPARLEAFKVICKKTEELAKDLLCYSLGRFRQKDQ